MKLRKWIEMSDAVRLINGTAFSVWVCLGSLAVTETLN